MSYQRNLDSTPENPVARLLARIGDRDLVGLFGGRATLGTIINWRTGRRNIPGWAIDCLRRRWNELDAAARADLARTKPGPGLKAGARNLAEWRVKKAREG